MKLQSQGIEVKAGTTGTLQIDNHLHKHAYSRSPLPASTLVERQLVSLVVSIRLLESALRHGVSKQEQSKRASSGRSCPTDQPLDLFTTFSTNATSITLVFTMSAVAAAPGGTPTSMRPSTTPARSDVPPSPRRQQSQNQAHTRSASASAAPQLANVARNDFESSNVAQSATSSRHPARSDSTRNTTAASQSRYHSQEMHTSTSNGTHAAAASGTNVRRRTTIDATTGHWDLGKTIGAGSMGKVKLARNKETGEQVGQFCDMHS